MNESGFGGWLGVIIIIVLLLGGGGGIFGGNNAAAEVQNSINAAFAQQNAQNILLSSANNNYETARLIDNQSIAMMNQNNTNLLTAVNGFNTISQNIANGFNSVNQNIANLGYKMDECCCSIKTMMLENRLQDTQIALQNQQNIAVNQNQTEYLLSVMGNWTPKAAAAGVYAAAK